MTNESWTWRDMLLCDGKSIFQFLHVWECFFFWNNMNLYCESMQRERKEKKQSVSWSLSHKKSQETLRSKIYREQDTMTMDIYTSISILNLFWKIGSFSFVVRTALHRLYSTHRNTRSVIQAGHLFKNLRFSLIEGMRIHSRQIKAWSRDC